MKKYCLIFIFLCMSVCLLPFAGMLVHPTYESTENKKMAEFPSLYDQEGVINLKFTKELEEYFNEHFAFRNEFIYADAKLQTSLFQVSNVDNVIFGKNGWLYYTSTLNDYTGRNPMSDRNIYNLVHNLRLVQDYVEKKNSQFLFVVPPNKNTLYGDNMPYYDSYVVEPTHAIERMSLLLEEKAINYADLLSMFRGESEILYLKRDSHWNRKGALMAYNDIMDSLKLKHEDYSKANTSRVQNADGDLNRMLYTFYGEKELDYNYDIEQKYSYVNEIKSVEDGWIETEGGSGNASLLMFRDSFGNTLIPFIANQFEKAWFTKEVPYGLENLMDTYQPDTVILEKVERNLSEFIKMPPIISAPECTQADLSGEFPIEELDTDTTIGISDLEYDYNYYKVSGCLDDSQIQDHTDVILQVGDRFYEAYQIQEYEYELYLKKDEIQEFPLEINVLIRNGDRISMIQKMTIEEGDLLQ